MRQRSSVVRLEPPSLTWFSDAVMRKIVAFLSVVIWCASAAAQSKDIEVVTITGKGLSTTREEAVSKALVEAIGKVNPTAVSAMNAVRSSVQSSRARNNGTTQSDLVTSKQVDREFEQATRGVLKTWEVMSEGPSGSLYEVIVSADVFRLKDSKQLSRKRISVLVSDDGQADYSALAKQSLEEAMVKSRKFAILQDNSAGEIQRFVETIKEQGRIEDSVRLQGIAAPELIAVVSARDFVRSGSRIRGKVMVDVIDYASGQIKYRNSLDLVLRDRDEARNRVVIERVTSELSRQLIAHVYPPLVVGWNGSQITLGLGDGFFSEGDTVEIKESLGGIRDRYTGEFLEDNLKLICKAIVRSVSSRVSLAEPRGDCGIPFVAGSTDFVAQIEEKIFVASRVSYSAPSSLSNSTSGGGSRRPSSSSDFKGLFKSDN